MKKEYIAGIFLILLAVGTGFFAFQKKQRSLIQDNVNTNTGIEFVDEKPIDQLKPRQTVTSSLQDQTSTPEKQSEKPAEQKQVKKTPTPSQKKPIDMSQDELLAALQSAGKKEQYATFADYLAEVYSRKLEGKDDFKKAESAAYVKASDYLDKEKNAQKALDAANAVYNKVPFGWRFKYLRVRALEALGRKAFDAGDLVRAEGYAHTMLQMEFRPEATDLLADIFIQKMRAALAKGDKRAAQEAYEEIKVYEVSADKKATLDELVKKTQ